MKAASPSYVSAVEQLSAMAPRPRHSAGQIAYHGPGTFSSTSAAVPILAVDNLSEQSSEIHQRNRSAKEISMLRTASAVWRGGLKDGKGTISSQSGVLKDTQYSFGTRFENGIGTNPEELIGAAHAGCFTMALSAQLGNANLKPESLETTAEVKFEKVGEGF